ncbi:MAG: response regulator [bacterium]
MSRILVIDDDSQIQDMLKQMLERAGYDVIIAPNGKVAVKINSEKPADLIITDLIMPEMEGIETIRKLKRDFPDVAIIAMSGGGRIGPDSYLGMVKKFGVKYTFVKPIKREDLLTAIREILNQQT